ncbi:MAG: transposase [Victivallales bacterium]
MTRKLKILFLCTGNSCRSQMAEGWCRHLKGDIIDAYSAGIETHGLNPNAVKVMAEAGVDISEHRSKHVDELKGISFDYVITVCGHANENCPLFPGKTKVIHIGFEDPPKLAKSAKSEQEALECYRRVRDQIRYFVDKIPDNLMDMHLSTEGGLSSPPTEEINRGLENPRSVAKKHISEPKNSFNFYNPYETVERTEHHLPHRQQGSIYYFVSWRMADSIAKEKLLKWKTERDFWLESHPEPWDDETENEFHDRFSRTIDEWLDAGEGSCLLRNPQISKIVADSFMHFNGIRYSLKSFVIMPNHVHVLFTIITPFKLEQIVKSWKGFTAYKINEILNKTGDFWQEDYWDRMVRGEMHLRKCHEYILQNPVKAHLHDGQYRVYATEGGLSSPPTEGKRGLENPRSF